MGKLNRFAKHLRKTVGSLCCFPRGSYNVAEMEKKYGVFVSIEVPSLVVDEDDAYDGSTKPEIAKSREVITIVTAAEALHLGNEDACFEVAVAKPRRQSRPAMDDDPFTMCDYLDQLIIEHVFYPWLLMKPVLVQHWRNWWKH